MGHNHSHEHHTDNKKVLFISFLIIFGFMIVEAIGGFLTNSLALLSDAGHMLSDAASLGLSLIAFKIGTKKATESKTYGYSRMEILAAFINGITLIVISVYIFYEAYKRFLEPPEVSASMMIIAAIGLVVNIVVAWMLMRGDSKENLNIRSALLHVFGDLLGSIGALVAGVLILLFSWNIADPIASVVVAILIISSGIRITRDAAHVLMEGKPDNINVEDIHNELVGITEVKDAHHLHVWSITSDFPALTCHLVVDSDVDRDKILVAAQKMLKNKFGISHSTIQIEGKNTATNTEGESCDE
ncbi:Cadmium, cobalt and zinc/H(+)-K(+) antiporter [Lentibacillus sp. JNUCC-1]|uniref:cation diffusion facilitator family transporter n=1 Tax=Lentibacillus sp. JNUCC-1 TaxID=2654513 RepID=UPI0012E71E72|nr:cation diffusion facilitator family transporter [Lentibacillus sp. JNUCC-1]MUV36288.1 Cadmium, cobalt and zinc/H(+)-K(+) antiporter [Lentibacillus sp. JNUCC-1]